MLVGGGGDGPVLALAGAAHQVHVHVLILAHGLLVDLVAATGEGARAGVALGGRDLLELLEVLGGDLEALLVLGEGGGHRVLRASSRVLQLAALARGEGGVADGLLLLGVALVARLVRLASVQRGPQAVPHRLWCDFLLVLGYCVRGVGGREVGRVSQRVISLH